MGKSRQSSKASEYLFLSNNLTYMYVSDDIVCHLAIPACNPRDFRYVYKQFLKIILKASMATLDESEPKYFF